MSRVTLVFVLEGGSWKIVQRHGSVPVANGVSMGAKQSGLAELADAAQESLEHVLGQLSMDATRARILGIW